MAEKRKDRPPIAYTVAEQERERAILDRHMPRTEQEAIERLRRVSNDLHVLAQNTAGHPSPAMQTLADAVDEVVATLSRPADGVVPEEAALRDAATLIDLAPLPPHISEEEKARAYLAVKRLGVVPEAERLTPEMAQMVLNDLADFDQFMGGGPDDPVDVGARQVLRTIASSKEEKTNGP